MASGSGERVPATVFRPMLARMFLLKEWIDEKEEDILTIRDRLGVLKPLEKELSGRTANRHVYFLVVDAYRILVVDLASFFTGLLETDLKDLCQLTRGRPPKDPSRGRNMDERTDLLLAGDLYQYRQEAFDRLFPSCTGDHPRRTDVHELRKRIKTLSKRCVDARNIIHAHRFERTDEKEPDPPLELVEIEALFVEVQSIFNDLRLVALDSYFGYPEIREEEETAKDLRDIMRHGSIGRFCAKIGLVEDAYAYERLRDAFYGGEAPED